MTTPFLPSPLYFIQQPLQQVIHDKDDGSLLAGGRVEYYSDPQFNEPKNVYEVSNAPDGTYYFSNIGSVRTLSSIGSFVDDDGNNFTPMLFPWTGDVLSPGQFEPYYIRVYSATNILQFTVTGYPLNNFSIAGLTEEGGDTSNQITNPQFVEALIPAAGITITVSGAMTIPVAPSWFVDVSGSGTIFLQQEPLDIQTPSDAPFALTIRTTGDTSGTLYQRITNSPRLLFEETIAGYLEINSAQAFALTMTYAPSGGTGSADIFTATVLADNEWHAFKGAVAISGTANPQDGNKGYVDIRMNIPTLANFMITAIQVDGVADVNTVRIFQQISTPLQESQLFYYWQEWLNYKPIPSYLVGWDFPLNPTQPNGDSGDFTVQPLAGNKSAYAWDQTILFATVGGQLSYSRNATTQGLKIGTGAATSFAVIQYLPVQQARELLSQRNCVSIQGFLEDTNPIPATSIAGTVSLWWTTGALPDLKTPNFNSLVNTVSALGVPTSTWTQVPNVTRGNNAGFTFGISADKEPIYLSGWDATVTSTAADTANYIAIVVAFSTIETTQTVTIDFCGLFGGDIATRPAPQTQDEVLRECQYYYQKSFIQGTVPAANVGLNQGEYYFVTTVGPTFTNYGPFVQFAIPMYVAPPNVLLYNPSAAGDQIRVITGGAANTNFTLTTLTNAASRSSSGFAIQGTVPASSTLGALIAVNWTADARLGTL